MGCLGGRAWHQRDQERREPQGESVEDRLQRQGVPRPGCEDDRDRDVGQDDEQEGPRRLRERVPPDPEEPDRDREKGLGLGADAYVVKPFAPKELRRLASDLLARSRGQE